MSAPEMQPAVEQGFVPNYQLYRLDLVPLTIYRLWLITMYCQFDNKWANLHLGLMWSSTITTEMSEQAVFRSTDPLDVNLYLNHYLGFYNKFMQCFRPKLISLEFPLVLFGNVFVDCLSYCIIILNLIVSHVIIT